MGVSKSFTENDIRRAMSHTMSNRAAARYLHCNFFTYRKYARAYTDQATGLNLFELHRNECGKGIPKNLVKGPLAKINIEKILSGEVPIEHFSPAKIKDLLISLFYLKEECHSCGFKDRRIIDYKIPLLLSFKDRDKKNFSLDNLELLCYNCHFLYVGNLLSKRALQLEEDYRAPVVDTQRAENWDLDEHHIEHLKSLGLWDETPNPMDGTDLLSYK
jgi:5-methylcytosine-specific restriction endonuclease McrA